MINDLIFYPKVVSKSLIILLYYYYNKNIILNFFVIESISINERFVSQVQLTVRSYFMKVETEQRYVKILIIFDKYKFSNTFPHFLKI